MNILFSDARSWRGSNPLLRLVPHGIFYTCPRQSRFLSPCCLGSSHFHFLVAVEIVIFNMADLSLPLTVSFQRKPPISLGEPEGLTSSLSSEVITDSVSQGKSAKEPFANQAIRLRSICLRRLISLLQPRCFLHLRCFPPVRRFLHLSLLQLRCVLQ